MNNTFRKCFWSWLACWPLSSGCPTLLGDLKTDSFMYRIILDLCFLFSNFVWTLQFLYSKRYSVSVQKSLLSCLTAFLCLYHETNNKSNSEPMFLIDLLTTYVQMWSFSRVYIYLFRINSIDLIGRQAIFYSFSCKSHAERQVNSG